MANTPSKVIKVAEAEVGYVEKKSNAQLDSKTANAGKNNYTKYWKDLAPGMNGQAWCNCFVNWCFVKAFGEKIAKTLLCTNGGWSFYTPTSAGYFKNKKQWYTSRPQVGDVIYFKNSQRICHVGLVYKVDNTKVYTIEGNTSAASGVVANGGGVAKKSYPLNYSSIAGYGRPKYDNTDIEDPKPSALPPMKNPYSVSNEIIKKGSKGNGVKWLQWELKQEGYNITVDGVFGDITLKLVKDYQKKNGLTVDGEVGDKTKAKLKKN